MDAINKFISCDIKWYFKFFIGILIVLISLPLIPLMPFIYITYSSFYGKFGIVKPIKSFIQKM